MARLKILPRTSRDNDKSLLNVFLWLPHNGITRIVLKWRENIGCINKMSTNNWLRQRLGLLFTVPVNWSGDEHVWLWSVIIYLLHYSGNHQQIVMLSRKWIWQLQWGLDPEGLGWRQELHLGPTRTRTRTRPRTSKDLQVVTQVLQTTGQWAFECNSEKSIYVKFHSKYNDALKIKFGCCIWRTWGF